RNTGRNALAAQVIGEHQDTRQVVGRMAALGAVECIVVFKPAYQAAETESRGLRIELVTGSRHASAMRHHSAWHAGTDQRRAFGKIERVKRAGESVDQAQTRRINRLRA